jgi:hypothetical protein
MKHDPSRRPQNPHPLHPMKELLETRTRLLIVDLTLWLGSSCENLPLEGVYTVRTVAADLRRGEHIPKMQNNIGSKSILRVLRQLKSKDGARGGLGAVPYCAVPCRATPRGARPGAAFPTTAVNLSQIEFGDFGSGRAKNTRTGSIQVPSGL